MLMQDVDMVSPGGKVSIVCTPRTGVPGRQEEICECKPNDKKKDNDLPFAYLLSVL